MARQHIPLMRIKSSRGVTRLQMFMTRFLFQWIVAGLACSVLAAGASAQTLSTGAFRDLSAIEKVLRRGVTRRDEVRQRFGEPNGTGAWRFAVLGDDECQVWYYEDLELTGTRAAQPVVELQMRQQILMVVFKGEVVDGYMWTSNAGRAELE